ncbi:MAG: zinc ribbon domain-containing protein [Acetatifactor sp.]
MNKLKRELIKTNFAKLLKRWLVLALCVVLLGGGLSAVMLRPQIRDFVTAVQSMERKDDNWENSQDKAAQKDLERDNDREEHHLPKELDITEPSLGAKITVGITVLLGCLIGAAFWLLVAAWLYQMAMLSCMNGLFWGLLGLGGNVFSVIVFFLVRSFIRQKCPACGHWQKKGSFCRACGAEMYQTCPACGAECETEDLFCTSCGKMLNNTEGVIQ